jgi:hypothetical protein
MEKAKLIAKALAGSWREFPAALELSTAELEVVTPMLLSTGAGALGWKRVSDSSLRTAPAAHELEQAYRLHALQSAINERRLKSALKLLRSAGVEPILVKGWAVARLYPDSGLRPYGDLDLCVAAAQYQIAKRAIANNPHGSFQVDLHRGFKTLDHKTWDELWSRSQLAQLGDTSVRVLSPEDHLRVLCFHFLREGAWRPLWLCDIAVAIETRPSDFDWDLFSGQHERQRRWFACALALAEQLLGADLKGIPERVRSGRLPRWFLPTVLNEWEARSMSQRHATPMSSAWSRPMQTLSIKSLRAHWPNPIEATIGVNGPFNEIPRLPFQLGNCALRTLAFLRHSRSG